VTRSASGSVLYDRLIRCGLCSNRPILERESRDESSDDEGHATKVQTMWPLFLCVTGVAIAQDTPTQTTTSAPIETPTTEAPATGNTVTLDAGGGTVFVTSRQPSPPPHDYRAEFNALDSDGDGSVSRSEASADKYLARAFATYESDRNDALSFEESRLWLED